MATYKSFNELNGKTLKLNDIVYFGKHSKHKYLVKDCYLFNSLGRNNHIFDIVKQKSQYKDKLRDSDFDYFLANTAYGYSNSGGEWPQSLVEDFEALTRLTLVLFALLEGSEVIEVKIRDKWVEIDINKFKESKKFVDITEYTAIVNYAKKTVTVGCSTFSFKDVENVYKALMRK